MSGVPDYPEGSKSKYHLNDRSRGLIVSPDAIVKNEDEAKYGEYRTKRVILEMLDEMKAAMEIGKEYRTWLNPPPADERLSLSTLV